MMNPRDFYIASLLLLPGRWDGDSRLQLIPIAREIEQLPRLAVTRHELHIPAPHRAIALVFPEDRLLAIPHLPVECRAQAQAFHRNHVAITAPLRILHAGDIHERRHQVDQMPGVAADLAARGDARRPADDERRRYAAFVDEVF